MTGEEVLMRARVAELWRNMCSHDGIDPESRFVVFSPTNPYAAEYHEEVGKLLAYLGMKAGVAGPIVHWGEPRPAFE